VNLVSDDLHNPETGEEVDAALDEIYGDLIDENARIVQLSRQIADLLRQVEEAYVEQVERCQQARALVVQGAQIVAGTTAAVIASEWGLVEGVPDDGDADDELVEEEA
jgi:hypothetical protein